MSYNRVILMGRITHDLELRTTQSGINMCSFQIAVDRHYQTKGEERKSDFFRVVTWRQQAEFVTRYFKKGSMILVDGELQTDTYTDKNGNTVNSVQISADQINFTGEKASNPQGGTNSYGNNAGGYQQNGGNNGGYSQNNAAYASAPQQGVYSAPQQPTQGGAPSDFNGASDDNYPF